MTEWVDLFNGFACDVRKISHLAVAPPTFPRNTRPFREEISWKVVVGESVNSTIHIACHWDEASARTHARTIVEQMLAIAEIDARIQ